jgi:putative DNA primase/helicase
MATIAEPVWWCDELTDSARVTSERNYGAAFGREMMHHAVRLAAEMNPSHPLREYLEGLTWDGKRRLNRWLSRYMRVKDTPYSRAVGSKWMLSAVARAYIPGCQADYVLIIEGGQRAGKSTGIAALCHLPEWYLETGVELGSKDAFHQIRNKWIVELAELDSLSRADASRIKAFITAKTDSYRPSYGRESIDQPRGCVFVGTTNEQEYLRDETGGGRWWPVWSHATIGSPIDVEALRETKDQLWAEAVSRYKAGEPWHITDPAILAAIAEAQEERRQNEPWETPVRRYLNNPKRQEEGVTALQVLQDVIGIPPTEADKGQSMKMVRVLVSLGWRHVATPRLNGRQVKIYKPQGVTGVTDETSKK